MLRRNTVGGYVNDRAGASVVFVISKVLAILLGMAAWAWFDALAETSTLHDIVRNLDSPILVALFFFAWLYLVQVPVFTIIIICRFQSYLTGAPSSSPSPPSSLSPASARSSFPSSAR